MYTPNMVPNKVRRFALNVNPMVNEIILRSKVMGGLIPIKNPSVNAFLKNPSGETDLSISPRTPPKRVPIKINRIKNQKFFFKTAIQATYYIKTKTSSRGQQI